jgi:Ca-activated chloride channel family protein
MANRAAFESALFALAPDGGTNAEAGLVLGYAQAEGMLDPHANNRVVLCSDGVANIGQTEHDALTERVKAWREKGIFLNTIGVGMGNHNDVLLEQLADRGDGVCRYVDSPAEAKKVMVDELVGTFETIARDVKLQVEFDPARVKRWRLLGYENRAVADADFRDDEVDAGEAQAGRQTTALYELDLDGAVDGDPVIGKLHARWLPLARGEQQAQERTLPIRISHATWTFDAASAGFRRSALVAQAAELLRGSVHARGDSIDELIAESEKLALQLREPSFDEFVGLVKRARELLVARSTARPELQRLAEELRANLVRQQALEQQAREHGARQLAEALRQNRELEERIRALTQSGQGGAGQR